MEFRHTYDAAQKLRELVLFIVSQSKTEDAKLVVSQSSVPKPHVYCDERWFAQSSQ